MQKKSSIIVVKIFVVITFIAMVVANALANILPVNGQNTGQISDSYPNLFAPAGITFSIWGVIYLLLALYTFYQLFLYKNQEIIFKVGIIFSISCIANTVWIFAWHYNIIPLSMLLTLVMLISIIAVTKIVRQESFIVRVPFSVYFGWLTVATIANATVLLVDLEWKGFGISQDIWTIVVLIVGIIIGTVTCLKNKDIAYGLVLIWAYLGIFIKHESPTGFQGQYLGVVITVVAGIVIFVLSELYVVGTLFKLREKS